MPTRATEAKFAWATAGLAVLFACPLYDLVFFALHSELYSYILLVPAVSSYLAWQRRDAVSSGKTPMRTMAWPLIAAALVLIGWYGFTRGAGRLWPRQDYLSVMILAWLLLVGAAGIWLFDFARLRAFASPLVFLIFMVPLPMMVEAGLEAFLQNGSALAARLFFSLTGMPYVYESLTFNLPGFNMHVAPECSGVHSSLVLFMTSVVAGQMFLRSPRKQLVFMAAVIPLGLLRNGFRAFVIGELCVHIGPEMSDSWIHHRGGPVFFLLSLVPLLLFLRFLIRSERRAEAASEVRPHSP
jgi:exosortase C (VPDSG-CTERM-specific)